MAYSRHSLRLKKEPLKDLLREPRMGISLPPTSPFVCPLCFSHCRLKRALISHLVETLVLDEQSHLLCS